MGMSSPGNLQAGYARGVVELDISQLERAAAHARALGQAFESALGNVSNGAARAQSTFQQLTAGITSLRGELLAIGAGAGLLTGLGLSGAQNLRAYTIAFRQFTNSQKEAVELTNHLIDLANKYGIEWEGVFQLSRSILPNLKGGTQELDEWISRAIRLRTLFPQAPRGSETIAINEFRTGNTRSLALRFNVPLDVIREATALFKGDYGAALDYILERQGATEEAALAMANSFTGVRNELQLLLAQGFMPLFEFLRPILATFREWVSAVRETQPELLAAGAGLTALTAAGIPAVLMFNQLVTAAEKLRALGVLGTLGRIGGVGLAAGAGVALGIGATNAIGQATGNERLANAGLGDLGQILQKLLFNIAWFSNRLAQIIVELGARLINAFGSQIDVAASLLAQLANATRSMLTAIGQFISGLGSLLPGGMGDTLRERGAKLSAAATPNGRAGAAALAFAEQFRKDSNARLLAWSQSIIGNGSSDVGGGGGFTPPGDDLAERNKIISDWARATTQIEADAAQQRLQATQQYESQRSQTIAQYELGIARDAEDFARSRQRQAAQLAQQIADVQADAQRREALQIRDYTEKIAELRQDANERVAEIEESYAEDREKAERDHRDRLMSAAARLDAVGVFEEQRRFKNQQEDAEKAFGERLTTEQDNLQERLDEEKRGHERRLAEARDADARRIEDMRESLAESQTLEDEDRAIRLERQAQDHAAQLSQMATAQAERMAQISSQAAREKAALDESFQQQLSELGVHNENWLRLQQAKQDASIKLFDAWWEAVNKRFGSVVQGPKTEAQTPAPAFPSSFAAGGWVQRSGMAMVHAGEYVANRQTAAAMAGGMARDITVGDIYVTPLPGMDTDALAVAVRRELMAALEEAA